MIIYKRKNGYVRRGRVVRKHNQHYHVNPMRPKDTKELPKGKDWVYQPKYDGSRTILITTPNDTKIINRRNVDKSRTYPELNQLHKRLGPGNVIDGEVINITKEEPYGSFYGLSKRDHLSQTNPEVIKKFPLSFAAFDALRINNKDLTKEPLTKRNEALRKKIKDNNKLFVVKTYNNIPVLNGVEGIVAKKKNSTYKEDKSSDWQKYKYTKEADVKVLGLTPGTGKRAKTFGTMRVGIKKRGKIVEVANVGTGFSDEDLKNIKHKLPSHAKVKYQRVGSKGRLIAPRFIASRNDITDKDTHI